MPPPRLLPLFVAVALPLTTVAAKVPPVMVIGSNVIQLLSQTIGTCSNQAPASSPGLSYAQSARRRAAIL
jgi:hypothetical protein